MNKKILAAAALALVSGVAMADASLYGILDASVSNVTNAGGNVGAPKGTTTGLTDGVWLPSLFGIKGSEDLGNGMKADFDLQSNLQTNNGTAGGTIGTTSQLFDRYAMVGLSGKFGSIHAGNMIDPLFLESFLNGVRQAHSASLAVNGQIAYGTANNNNAQVADTRVNNLVTYQLPKMYDTTVTLGYQFGNTAGNNTVNSGQIIQFDHAANGLDVNGGYEVTNGDVGTGATGGTSSFKLKKWVLGANYTMGAVKFAGQINSFKSDTAGFTTSATAAPKTDAVGYELGVAYNFSPALTGALNYTWANDNVNHVTPTDASASLKYSLSKRTSLWALYSRADAKGYYGSGWTAIYVQNSNFVNSAAGQQDAVSVGLTHTF